jgi:hypothetical protein
MPRPTLPITDAQREELDALRRATANAGSVEKLLRELVWLRTFWRGVNKLNYVRNAPPVRRILDQMPKGL